MSALNERLCASARGISLDEVVQPDIIIQQVEEVVTRTMFLLTLNIGEAKEGRRVSVGWGNGKGNTSVLCQHKSETQHCHLPLLNWSWLPAYSGVRSGPLSRQYLTKATMRPSS
jgi:hypothetical protein